MHWLFNGAPTVPICFWMQTHYLRKQSEAVCSINCSPQTSSYASKSEGFLLLLMTERAIGAYFLGCNTEVPLSIRSQWLDCIAARHTVSHKKRAESSMLEIAPSTRQQLVSSWPQANIERNRRASFGFPTELSEKRSH